MENNNKQILPPLQTGGMVHRDWTQGSIVKNLLQISWPMIVTQMLMMLGPTIDMIWVGKLGNVAVAAVGVGGSVVMLAVCLMMGLNMGTLALISRAFGGKDYETAQRAAQQAFAITAIYSITMAVIGRFFAEKIMSLVTTDPEVIRLGAIYLRIEFIGGLTIAFRMLMDIIMQASGDTMNPMWISLVYRAVHIALCPFLVFGWWVFPELGISGAAYTGIIAQGLGIVLGLMVLLSGKSHLKLSFRKFRIDMSMIWRIIRVGLPASISDVQRNLSQFFIQIFIASFGTAALAAHNIAQRLEMFCLVPAMALGMGAGVLVGQNLGAKKPERAEKSVWTAVLVIEAFIIVLCVSLFIWAKPVVHLFNDDPALEASAVVFIRISLVGFLAIGFVFVLMSSIQAAGDTVPAMIINIAGIWGISMPLAYFLPRYTDWGVDSIRWALAASIIATAVALVIYFRIGRWKKRKV